MDSGRLLPIASADLQSVLKAGADLPSDFDRHSRLRPTKSVSSLRPVDFVERGSLNTFMAFYF